MTQSTLTPPLESQPETSRESSRAQPQTTRMFETEFLERFSRIHPATPFVVWVPVVLLVVIRAHSRHDVSVAALASLFAAGAFAWTLAEYVLHRWVFHWDNGTTFSKRLHFLIHGVHHDYPNDKDRLVMPLLASVPLSVIFYTLFCGSFGQSVGEPLFAGFVTGYLAYDGTHFAVHHFKLQQPVFKRLRKHHMLHHHADHDGGFGVSSPLWDLVFRTMPRHKRA